MQADQEIRKLLEKAKIDVLLNFPFYGVLLSKMPLVEVKRTRTMATDYRRIYYNPDFVRGLKHDELVFALGHEIHHCVFGHHIRKNNRDHEWWNMAGDYAINYDLVNMSFTRTDGTKLVGVGKIKSDWLYDKKYADWPTEKIYQDLADNNAPKQNTLDDHLSPGQENSGEGDEPFEDDGVDDGEEIEALPDVPMMSESEFNYAEQQFIRNMFYAEQACPPGQIPGKIKRHIKDLKESKKDWRTVLRSKVESAFKPNKTWMNPSRRSWSQGFIMPGPAPELAIEVAIALDLSGSISINQANDLLSEVAGIMQQFRQYKIWLWTFDSIVYDKTMVQFDESTGFDLLDFSLRGGGGTDFGKNWSFMKSKNIKPHRFIMFTDGYCDFKGCDPDYVDTVWLVHSNPHFKAPFGLALPYEERK